MFKNEYDIIKAAQSGDNAAKEQLFENYNKLIIMIANKVKRYAEDFEEIYQWECIEFVKVLNKFDISKGYKFSTYLYPRIEGAAKRYYRDFQSIVKHKRERRKIFIDIAVLDARGKTEKEICNILDIKLEEINSIRLEFSKMYVVSLNVANKKCDNEKVCYIDMLQEQENSYKQMDDRIMLESVIKNLKNINRKVLFKYYFEDKTQVQIATELGISQVQVSRRLMESLKELKKMLIKDGVENA